MPSGLHAFPEKVGTEVTSAINGLGDTAEVSPRDAVQEQTAARPRGPMAMADATSKRLGRRAPDLARVGKETRRPGLSHAYCSPARSVPEGSEAPSRVNGSKTAECVAQRRGSSIQPAADGQSAGDHGSLGITREIDVERWTKAKEEVFHGVEHDGRENV